MRLRILVGSLALPLMVVSQLSFTSAAATEPASVSPSEEVVGLCGTEGLMEILEPEAVGACSTGADLARIVPPVKQPDSVDSSTASAALEPGFVFPRIAVSVGPPTKEIAARWSLANVMTVNGSDTSRTCSARRNDSWEVIDCDCVAVTRHRRTASAGPSRT